MWASLGLILSLHDERLATSFWWLICFLLFFIYFVYLFFFPFFFVWVAWGISMLIKIQLDATVCRYLFTAKLLYMFQVPQHPSSGVLKTVTAPSGTGHNTGAATSLQCGLIGLVCTNQSDQAMLEGSSCTSIMTCTGGCGYSF